MRLRRFTRPFSRAKTQEKNAFVRSLGAQHVDPHTEVDEFAAYAFIGQLQGVSPQTARLAQELIVAMVKRRFPFMFANAEQNGRTQVQKANAARRTGDKNAEFEEMKKCMACSWYAPEASVPIILDSVADRAAEAEAAVGSGQSNETTALDTALAGVVNDVWLDREHIDPETDLPRDKRLRNGEIMATMLAESPKKGGLHERLLQRVIALIHELAQLGPLDASLGWAPKSSLSVRDFVVLLEKSEDISADDVRNFATFFGRSEFDLGRLASNYMDLAHNKKTRLRLKSVIDRFSHELEERQMDSTGINYASQRETFLMEVQNVVEQKELEELHRSTRSPFPSILKFPKTFCIYVL